MESNLGGEIDDLGSDLTSRLECIAATKKLVREGS